MIAPPACKALKIEISSHCNANCLFCWMIRSPRKPQGFMSFDNFKKVIDLNKNYFKEQKTLISPFFNGEALIHPQIFEILDYIVSNNLLFGSIDTNMGMHIDIKKLMSYPFPIIGVSIGGTTKEVHEKNMGTSFDIVTSNLKQMFKIDKERVLIKMVPTKHNVNQIPELSDFLKGLGGNPAHYVIATTGFMLPTLATKGERDEFFKNVVSEEVREYMRFEYDLSKDDYGVKSKRPGCYFPIDCVHFDGKFTVCCHDLFGKINVGNAFEIPIYKLKKSKRYRVCREKARNMGFNFCKECN